MSAFVELELTAKKACDGVTSWRAAKAAAERVPFVSADGDRRELAYLQNSLKTLCLSWDDAPAGSAHLLFIKAAVVAVLSALAVWPVRVSAPAPRPRPSSTRSQPAAAKPAGFVPYYLQKD